jgi:hypothetical protein
MYATGRQRQDVAGESGVGFQPARELRSMAKLVCAAGALTRHWTCCPVMPFGRSCIAQENNVARSSVVRFCIRLPFPQMMESASSRFSFCSIMIFSSIVSRAISR